MIYWTLWKTSHFSLQFKTSSESHALFEARRNSKYILVKIHRVLLKCGVLYCRNTSPCECEFSRHQFQISYALHGISSLLYGCGTMFRNWCTITFLLCLMLLFTVFGLLRIALPSQIEQATGIVVGNCWNIVQHLFTLFDRRVVKWEITLFD